MFLEGIFSGLMTLAAIGWLVLAFSPLNRTYCIAFARIVALLQAAAYIAQFFLTTEKVEGLDLMTLSGLNILFVQPGNFMMAWTHYLAFDLFVGTWEVEDAAGRGIPFWLVLPCLFLTFMLGPFGLMLYFVIRTIRPKALPA